MRLALVRSHSQPMCLGAGDMHLLFVSCSSTCAQHKLHLLTQCLVYQNSTHSKMKRVF